MSKKTWVIIGVVLISILFVFLYFRKFSKNILFEFDLVPNINKSETGKFSIPIQIIVKNKNSRGITIRSIDISILKEGKLIAKSEKPQDFDVKGGGESVILHHFAIIDLQEITKIAFAKNQTEVKIVVSFRFLFLPITISFNQYI